MAVQSRLLEQSREAEAEAKVMREAEAEAQRREPDNIKQEALWRAEQEREAADQDTQATVE